MLNELRALAGIELTPTCRFAKPFSGQRFVSPPRIKPAVNVTSDAVPASCASTITPACLQALYGIPTAPATVRSNQLGVSGFIDQFANQADLRVAIQKWALTRRTHRKS